MVPGFCPPNNGLLFVRRSFMKIILIGGKARNGKDTLGNFMKEYYERHGHV